MKILFSLKSIIWDNDFETASLWMAVNLIGWGVWFAMPWDMRLLGRVYITFENVLPENAWATIFISLGIFRLVALAVDHYHDVLKFQIGGTLASIFIWTFSFAVFVQSEPRSILVYMSTFLSAWSLWELLRLMKKMQIRKEIRKERPNKIV